MRYLNNQQRQVAGWVGLIIWSAAVTWMAYGSALSLPFLFDDFWQMPYSQVHTIAEIWQLAKGPAYYRPLSYTVWKLMYSILGRHDEVALHALNLTLHAINALLIAWLGGRLWVSAPGAEGRMAWLRRYVCATLFLLFPLSYEVVPWISSVMYSQVTLLILLAIVCYWQMRTTGSRMWGVLGWVFALIGPFVHEGGILAAPLIAAIEVTRPTRDEPVWRTVRRIAVWSVPIVVWWLIWRQMPVPRGPDWLALNPTAIPRNAVYFAQSAAYPLTWLGSGLSEQLSIDNSMMAASLSVAALGLAALVQWRSGADRRAWLPWLWLALVCAPAVLFLEYKYVSGSPRMTMLPSVGAAWLWADVSVCLVAWWRSPRTHRRFRLTMAALLVTTILIQNMLFIADHMRVYQVGGAAIHQYADAADQSAAARQSALFINLPAWIAPSHATYAIGQEGFDFLPWFISLEQVAYLYHGRSPRVSAARVDAIQPEVPYFVGLRGDGLDWGQALATGGDVFVTRYLTDTAIVEQVGVISATLPAASPVARFDQHVNLRVAEATRTADTLRVTLTWQVIQRLNDEVTVFVHVIDANGQLIAQGDGDPLAGTFSLTQWPIGLVARDIRTISLPNVAGDLSVRVGVYSRSTGERLMATSDDGAPFADNAVPIAVR